MREIGGYFELCDFSFPMLYEKLTLLNCGRNALGYLIEARNIRKIALPYFLCDSVREVCQKYGVEIKYYHISEDFKPVHCSLEADEWLYVVNFYGQLDKEYILGLKEKYENVIVDNAQAYFDAPIGKVDTLYTCRKFFGVADGAVLATDASLGRDLPIDESFGRMQYLLGRYEGKAADFYHEYVERENQFSSQPIKGMSKLTKNFLHGIDYESIKKIRTDNYAFLHGELGKMNRLKLITPIGAFAYPLLLDGDIGIVVRKRLIERYIYIPTLWPDVLKNVSTDSIEHYYANNILPLPVDQRYGLEDMAYICKNVLECMS